jgi:transcriptional regulator with XRE-family HTH domain
LQKERWLALLKTTLRLLRRRLDITQSAAAEQLGISAHSLCNYEQGKFFPDVQVIDKILELYHVKYDEIDFYIDGK